MRLKMLSRAALFGRQQFACQFGCRRCLADIKTSGKSVGLAVYSSCELHANLLHAQSASKKHFRRSAGAPTAPCAYQKLHH